MRHARRDDRAIQIYEHHVLFLVVEMASALHRASRVFRLFGHADIFYFADTALNDARRHPTNPLEVFRR